MKFTGIFAVFLIFFFTVSLSYAQTFTRPLTIGSKGADVSQLQTFLKNKGYFTYPTVTGYFGLVTFKAVADFQVAQGLERVGSVGPLTRAILNNSGIASDTASSTASGTNPTLPITTPLIPNTPFIGTPTLPGYAPGQSIIGLGADDVAPIVSTQSATATGDSTASFSVTTNETRGTLYWVVGTTTNTLTKARVKAGQTYLGTTALASGSQAVSNSSNTVSISVSNLVPGVTYYIFSIQEDPEGNQSTIAQSSSFATQPTFDLNFVANSGYAGGSSQALTSLLTISRDNSTSTDNLAYAQNAAGDWLPFADNVMRITDLGILIEPGRQNRIHHNRDLTITNHVTVSGGSGTFTDGETVTATGGGSGTYVAANSTTTIFAIRAANSSTFSGTLTGGSSGATRTIGTNVAMWVRRGVTAAKDQVGIDGIANSATSITATATNGSTTQTVADGSRQRGFSVFVKRLSGTGTVEMTKNNGSSWTTITPTSSWARYDFGNSFLTTSNPTFGLRLGTSGDSIAVDFVQMENFVSNLSLDRVRSASSPIATTFGAVERNPDDITVTNPAFITTIAEGSLFAEVNFLDIVSGITDKGVARIQTDTFDSILIGNDTSNKIKGFSASAGVTTHVLSSTNTTATSTIYKTAFGYKTGDMAMAYSANLDTSATTTHNRVNGAGTTDSTGGTTPTGTVSTFYVGATGDLGKNLNGYLRRLTWSPTRLPNNTLLHWAQDL